MGARGLEGSLLATLLDEPIRLSTVTIGRKFDYRHCRRALGDVAVLQTGIRLESAVAAARGHAAACTLSEKGDGDESLTWTYGDSVVAQHDGRTGAPLPGGGAMSPVSRAKMLERVNGIRLSLVQPAFGTYAAAKKEGYQLRTARYSCGTNPVSAVTVESILAAADGELSL